MSEQKWLFKRKTKATKFKFTIKNLITDATMIYFSKYSWDSLPENQNIKLFGELLTEDQV